MTNLLFVYGTKELKVPNLASKQVIEALGSIPSLKIVNLGTASTWGKVKEPSEMELEFLIPCLSDSVDGEVLRIEGDLETALALLDSETGLFYERGIVELNLGNDELGEAWAFLASSWIKEGRISFRDPYRGYNGAYGTC